MNPSNDRVPCGGCDRNYVLFGGPKAICGKCRTWFCEKCYLTKGYQCIITGIYYCQCCHTYENLNNP